MNKKAIAVDIDDVLAAHVESFISFSNKHYGTTLSSNEYIDRWGELWHVDEDEAERRAAEFHAPEIVGNFRFIAESRPVLHRLKQDFTLFIVTARRKKHIELTRSYINKHLPDVFDDIHFVPIWEPDNTVTKLDICKEIGADYLIDDLPRHCQIAADGGITAILYGDYGWNRNTTVSPNVVRCRDWNEIDEYFSAKH